MGKQIQEYGPLRQIDEGLWTLEGEWYGSKLKRRMTLIQLRSGGLFVHNPIQLREKDYEQLTRMGPVETIIVPNAFHWNDAPVYKEVFPKASLLISEGAIDRVRKHTQVDGVLPGALGDSLRSEIECLEFEGTRLVYENVFFHHPTRTLIVTDLVFNLKVEVKGLERAFYRWNRIYQRFGPSRIFQRVFIHSNKKAEKSLARILHWNFDRVIMNHGEILEKNGKSKLTQSFKEIGLSPLL